MQIMEKSVPSEWVLVEIFHTKVVDRVCSWSISEGGKEISRRQPFLVFCQQISIVIAL